MTHRPTILIAGAAGALGVSVAEHLALAGHKLILVDLDKAKLEAALRDLAGFDHHIFAACDLTDDGATGALAAALSSESIAAVVHVAGGFAMGEQVFELTRAKWDHMLNLNVWSFVALMKAFVPALLAKGGTRIVSVSARAATRGAAQMASYCASKSALQRMVEALAAELIDKGVTVNSIAPSIIDTPANRVAMQDADFSRWVRTSDIAATIAFLLSDAAGAISGQHIQLDGRS